MKNILFLLILFSSGAFGQGMSMTVFATSCNCWVNKSVYETNNPPSTILGNAATATTAITAATLTTPRTINGVSFNGSANITVTADASTLTGLTLNPTVAVTESQVTNLTTDLGLKAPLANPTFTGTVTLPALAVTNAMLAGSIPYSKLTLTGAVLNADLAGSIAYSKLALTGAILNADLAGSIAYSKLSLTGAILNADLAGSIAESKVTNLVTDLAAKQGMTVAATSATTGTMTTTFAADQSVFTITPTGACTFNGTGGTTGQRATFVVTTSGASSFVLTWGTNFKTTATLATGVTTAKTFCVNFLNVAGTWIETGRTAAM